MRRAVARTATLLVVAACMGVGAQVPPRGVVRLVVPAPPGGDLDATARIVAEKMSTVTGDAFIVENRPGANSIVGTDYVAHAPGDGRTLLFAGASVFLNPLMLDTSTTLDDLRPVAPVVVQPYSLVVSSSLNVRTVGELEQLARARPGGIDCAAGPGPMLLGCEQLRQRFGGSVVSVPFAGMAPGLQALAGGHVGVMFLPTETAQAQLAAGRIRLLAVSRRRTGDDAVPLLGKALPGLLAEGFYGVYAPAGTPPARLRALEQDFATALADANVRQRLRAAGTEPLEFSSSDAFVAYVRELSATYTKIVHALGLDKH